MLSAETAGDLVLLRAMTAAGDTYVTAVTPPPVCRAGGVTERPTVDSCASSGPLPACREDGAGTLTVWRLG